MGPTGIADRLKVGGVRGLEGIKDDSWVSGFGTWLWWGVGWGVGVIY